MSQFLLYIHGLWMAIRGKYPHEELKHLEFVKTNIRRDAKWLCIHPGLEQLVERHELMCDSDKWKTTSFEGIASFRERIFESVHKHADIPPLIGRCGR